MTLFALSLCSLLALLLFRRPPPLLFEADDSEEVGEGEKNRRKRARSKMKTKKTKKREQRKNEKRGVKWQNGEMRTHRSHDHGRMS